MSGAHVRANEVQKTLEPVRQPGQELIRQQEQGPVQAVAPQAAFRRVQLNRDGLRPAEILALQRAVGNRQVQRMVMTMRDAAAQRPNRTGLPDGLKSGIETLSGIFMDNVNVHYNSSQPAQLNALAYTKGTDIHVAPGQERHLPHEAWHVVQQAQGRVQPTMQTKDGVPVNDDAGLEHEAEQKGASAASADLEHATRNPAPHAPKPASRVVQRKSKEQIIEAFDNYPQVEDVTTESFREKHTCAPFTNVEAAKTHMKRDDAEERNTVLADVPALIGQIDDKDKLQQDPQEAGWFRTVPLGPVNYITTRRNFERQPFPPDVTAVEKDKIKTGNKRLVVKDESDKNLEKEVLAAEKLTGDYPERKPEGWTGSLGDAKKLYLENVINKINETRRTSHENTVVTWTKQLFETINGERLNDINSLEGINNIPHYAERVQVGIKKYDGRIGHLKP